MSDIFCIFVTETIQTTIMTENKAKFMQNKRDLELAEEVGQYIRQNGCPCHDTEYFEDLETDSTHT